MRTVRLPYQRVSSISRYGEEKPRRVAAVCWHGHRDFMRAVFDINPDARLKSALADYRGRDDFERHYQSTYSKWGNAYHDAYGQSCTCANEPAGPGPVFMMRQGDIMACPHVHHRPRALPGGRVMQVRRPGASEIT